MCAAPLHKFYIRLSAFVSKIFLGSLFEGAGTAAAVTGGVFQPNNSTPSEREPRRSALLTKTDNLNSILFSN